MGMSQQLPECLARLDEMDAVWGESCPGARLAMIRPAGRALRKRLVHDGAAIAVRTAELVTFPYPTRYGLEGVAASPAPYVMMTNRVQLVQVSWQGELINVLINPSDPERSLAAPFFARQLERYGQLLTRRVLSKQHGTVRDALALWGVAPEEIDYITFDHLHVQDVRGLLGTSEPEPGNTEPTPPLLPNARLLAQASELQTFARLHPLQHTWYVADGLRGVSHDKIIALDGDYALGAGLALVRTPGHTRGNHSPTVVTDRGVWTISENGIAVDAYAPESSAIAGLRRHARQTGVEVILNANTRENTLDQYSSMVLEKTLADPSVERPEFPQCFPSSELTRSALAPGLAPTYSHGHITHGTLQQARRTSSAA